MSTDIPDLNDPEIEESLVTSSILQSTEQSEIAYDMESITGNFADNENIEMPMTVHQTSFLPSISFDACNNQQFSNGFAKTSVVTNTKPETEGDEALSSLLLLLKSTNKHPQNVFKFFL